MVHSAAPHCPDATDLGVVALSCSLGPSCTKAWPCLTAPRKLYLESEGTLVQLQPKGFKHTSTVHFQVVMNPCHKGRAGL